MPADDLSFNCDLRTWVRLEARPFHIPPRIALSRLSVMNVGLLWTLDEFSA
jgi:hypothetical protein